MDNRLFFPATQRNRDFIGDVLSRIINKGSVLEIGSGSGEHGVVFQKRFPRIIWQTSDPELVHRKSISSWIECEELTKKMPQPLEIDVEKIPWNIPLKLAHSLRGIVSINMIHVAHWSCTVALFRESGKLLNKGKFLVLYGPFKIYNKHISESNYFFDKSLKKQNNLQGFKNLEEVCDESKKNGFTQEDIIRMPANNFSIIYRKVS
ncbi:class I SAM-dependent methyltransferase [Prochlorococcus sp. AH-716-I17]|nr:class I SAM-dependent methyltransferase [Prochlorococcus sp. AH-716-I17]